MISIKARKYAREEHIDFPKIAIETFGMEDYHPVRAMWRRIKAKVDGVEDLSLEGGFSVSRNEIVDRHARPILDHMETRKQSGLR